MTNDMAATQPTQAAKAEQFLALHHQDRPLLMPNPWDLGSARLLASLDFDALATTSSGAAAALGRLDGALTREEAIAHAATIAGATELPTSADLQSGFGDEPPDVAATARLALAAGLAGFSIEDYSGRDAEPIYGIAIAAERIAAAAEVAHGSPVRMVLTARAENYLHRRPDLEDTIERLRAYETAGADVLYAPGIATEDEIGALVAALGKPVNVLARPGAPSVSRLAELGVRRVSVGGAFAFAALGTLVEAARELRDEGTYEFMERAGIGLRAVRQAFAP
jgi:2-methylisocitrate lyase-like PEP mutase family enzyme